MHLRRPVLAVLALLLLAPNAGSAGTAADPEVTDPCELGVVDADGPLTPWTDVCAAWLSVDGTTVTATVQVAMDAAQRPNPSYYRLEWTTDDGCTHAVGLSDRQVSDRVPDPPNVHRGGGEGGQVFASTCPAPPRCTTLQCYDYRHEAYVALPPAAVVTDGRTISFSVSFTGDLEGLADQYRPGLVLRGLTASTGVDCELCMIYSDATAPGRDLVIPEDQ